MDGYAGKTSIGSVNIYLWPQYAKARQVVSNERLNNGDAWGTGTVSRRQKTAKNNHSAETPVERFIFSILFLWMVS